VKKIFGGIMSLPEYQTLLKASHGQFIEKTISEKIALATAGTLLVPQFLKAWENRWSRAGY